MRVVLVCLLQGSCEVVGGRGREEAVVRVGDDGRGGAQLRRVGPAHGVVREQRDDVPGADGMVPVERDDVEGVLARRDPLLVRLVVRGDVAQRDAALGGAVALLQARKGGLGRAAQIDDDLGVARLAVCWAYSRS